MVNSKKVPGLKTHSGWGPFCVFSLFVCVFFFCLYMSALWGTGNFSQVHPCQSPDNSWVTGWVPTPITPTEDKQWKMTDGWMDGWTVFCISTLKKGGNCYSHYYCHYCLMIYFPTSILMAMQAKICILNDFWSFFTNSSFLKCRDCVKM